MLSFLLGDSSSICSTLDKDNEGYWEAENVSLLVANYGLCIYKYSNCHLLIH